MLRRPRAFESAATQRSRIARDQNWRIARRRGRRPRGNTEIQSDPNFKARFSRVFFEIGSGNETSSSARTCRCRAVSVGRSIAVSQEGCLCDGRFRRQP